MKVPFVDLLPQYLEVKDAIDEGLRSLIGSTDFIGGKTVKAFESLLARAEGRKHTVAVKSGTAALQLVLEGLDLPPGAEVITTTHTAVPTVEAIARAGLRPVLCDIDPATYQISADAAAAAVGSATRVLLPVHLYGIPAPLAELSALAKRHKLILIEDVAQAQGAALNGRRVGTWGAAACYSFFPSKCLGGFGDGGGVATDLKDLEEKVRASSNHGRLEKFVHMSVGANERLDALQAAVLSAKLPRLEAWNAMRRRVAQWYFEGLAEVGDVVLPREPEGAASAWHLFVIRTGRRDELARNLAKRGIQTGLHYPVPVHLHPAYAHLGHLRGAFPKAEAAADAILSLPMYPHLTEGEVGYVVEQVARFFAGRTRSPAASASRIHAE